MKRLIGILFMVLILTIVVLYGMGKSMQLNQDFSHVLFDREAGIINASVSADEQWRMQCNDPMPDKLKQAILLFEDAYFEYHPGVNPVSMGKAIRDNYQAGKIVRGGSTLTMQVARILEGNKPRTYTQKLKEVFLSFALELAYSKNEILDLYGQYAPFGGNVVGYCSASWKYFEKPADQLSWSEVASIAVLPNAPGKIFPGQDQAGFLKKRNFLLHKLHSENHFDDLSLNLALKEPLPNQFHIFQQTAPHLHQYLKSSGSFNEYSSIDGSLQKEVIQVLDNYGRTYSSNGVYNIASLVIDNKSGEVLSYVGNRDHSLHGSNRDVDVIQSERSPGSTLKPLLYALSFDEGLITEESLIEDVPLFLNGFSPQNYDHKFSGLVKAKHALTQSLNIPAVNLLQKYGIQMFINQLKTMGFTSTDQDDDHYGLSLILGANEVKPIELGQAYMNLARSASSNSSIIPTYRKVTAKNTDKEFPISPLSASQIIEVLTEVKRPRQRDGWEHFQSKRNMAWKTGTSFGNRDAWAVGITPDHTIVIWVGNATGEGKKGLTGLSKGAPILFSIFDLIATDHWFSPLMQNYKTVETCAQSGYRKSTHCKKSKMMITPKNAPSLIACPYHQRFILEQSRTYQINHLCYDVNEGVDTTLFILPPRVNHYVKLSSGVDYTAPATHPDCQEISDKLAIIYPPSASRVLLPREINNQQQPLISKAASTNARDTLYWFVDDTFIKLTTGDHSLLIPTLDVGEHSIAVTSIHGANSKSVFEVIEE